MTAIANTLNAETRDFIEQAKQEAELAFEVFRETDTITANGTVGFIERIPGQAAGEEKLLTLNYPGPFDKKRGVQPVVVGFDGTLYLGKSNAGYARYLKLFQEHANVTTISHVHSPALGAWAQTHRTLPIRYVPVQRFKLIREIPIYIDRRQQEVDFILDKLRENPHNVAVLEANGGSTVWGTKGLRDTAEFILLLEEGAKIQIAAEAIGGSRDYGPGVLAQQYKMSGLTEIAQQLGLLQAV
jgi:L-ribulose-5-phosphate 4-epimerase